MMMKMMMKTVIWKKDFNKKIFMLCRILKHSLAEMTVFNISKIFEKVNHFLLSQKFVEQQLINSTGLYNRIITMII